MAYHVARILHVHYGYDVCVLTDNPSVGGSNVHGMFRYDPLFPCLPLAGCEGLVGVDDVLLCNPSFSGLNLGQKVHGRKIMYVQGFTTFKILDCFFDHYVAVSGFVRGFLAQTYGIRAPVIQPFIPDAERAAQVGTAWDTAVAWNARPPFSLELNIKGDWAQQSLLLEQIRRELKEKDSNLEQSIDWGGAAERSRSRLTQDLFLERLSSARYLLTLSVAEGFGLVPLEAMRMGTAVLGFDGFGGREYMVPGQNCAVAEYPDVSGVVDGIIHAMRDIGFAQRLVAAGVETASGYNYESFCSAWVRELGDFLSR